MLGTRLTARLIDETQRAGAKTILVGDPRQLPEVEAGGLFAALVRRTQAVELTENRRQHDPAQRLTANALRAGRAELAVQLLDDGGRLVVGHNADELRDRLVADWSEHRRAGADVVMGAAHRADVADLNHRAHRLLESNGDLGPVVFEVGDRRFHAGDRVLVLKNRYDLGVLNGDVGVVVAGTADTVTVERDDGDRRELPVDYVVSQLDYAYARTVHKTQGLTCDVALLLGDDGLYAELGYTGLTRGSHDNRLYTVAPTPTLEGDDLAQLVNSLSTSRAKTAAIDVAEPAGIE